MGYLQDIAIVDHKELAEDVFETVYEDGSRVIVNYSDRVAWTDGTSDGRAAVLGSHRGRDSRLRLNLRTRQAINGYLFILPWLIGFTGLCGQAVSPFDPAWPLARST